MLHSSIATKPVYQDLIADAQYREASSQLLAQAKHQGQSDGLLNCPLSESEYHVRFVTQAFNHIQAYLDEYASRTPQVTGMVMATKIEQDAKEQERILRAALPDKEAEHAALLERLEHNKPKRWLNLIRGIVLTGLLFIAGAEAFINYPSFRAAALSVFNATVAATSVAIIVAIAAPLAARYIRKATSLVAFVYRTGLVLACAAIFFFLLGLLRLYYYSTFTSVTLDSTEVTLTAATPGHVAAWATCAVSFTLFAVALFASVRYYKSKVESISDQQYRDTKQKAESLAGEIRRDYAAISALRSNTQRAVAEAYARYEAALAHQRRLVNLGVHACTLYAKTNILFRPDKACPEFFSTVPLHKYTSVFEQAMSREAA